MNDVSSRETLAAGASVDAAEVEAFSRIAEQWWNPRGEFAPLHRFNPTRLQFVRELALDRFGRDAKAVRPFEGLRLLDIGCGGGLLSEPMTRLGFAVTGVDASARNIGVARTHADAQGLAIDYRCATAESLLDAGERPFDLVLNMEVIEHVAEPGAYLRDTARLVAPGGAMVVATLNRTWKALAFAKVGAEYVLRWLPRGAHDWRKFLRPEELRAFLSGEPGVAVRGPVGVSYQPLRDSWRLSDDADVNYMMVVERAADPLRLVAA